MTTIRYAAFVLAAITLWGLTTTPNSPATILLAGLFFTLLCIVAWTCRERRTDEQPD